LHYVQQLLGAVTTESSAVKFQQEVVLPAQQAADSGTRDLPGVDRPPVEVIDRFALVIPRPTDRRLRGNHLEIFAGFLDQQFREYDFRRGAADGRRVAQDVLHINYPGRPDPLFYTPDEDPAFRLPGATAQDDLPTYASLDAIPSTVDPHRSVRAVFESALDTRLAALIGNWDGPGPDMLLDPVVTHVVQQYARQRLPGLWG
ncbi:MAG TPA: hypothetical protein VM536_03180, partial [Chloroflexia bacterium]|nr:hypothetical protein [Chloroflexia bacterium]